MRTADTPKWLFEVDIRTLGCEVTRNSERNCTVMEPLSWTAPSIARVHCCYADTVIFHMWPWEVETDNRRRNKDGYREWERVRCLLSWDTEFLYDGLLWTANAGRVCRHRGGWWMRHGGSLKAGQLVRLWGGPGVTKGELQTADGR